MPPPTIRSLRRPLPKDTQNILTDHLCTFDDQLINLGLLLDKYQPWDLDQGQWELRWLDRVHNEIEITDQGAKTNWLSTLSKLTPNRFSQDLLDSWIIRLERGVNQNPWKKGTFTCAERLVIGLGAESTLETSLTLHSRYGIPFIPGSALKGLCRTVALFTLAISWEIPLLKVQDPINQSDTPLSRLDRLLETPEKPSNVFTKAFKLLQQVTRDKKPNSRILTKCVGDILEDTEFIRIRKIFGTQDVIGDIIFLDAPPAQLPKMAVEIMNPHYSYYYEEKKDSAGNPIPPQDDQDPNPIAFMVVDKGSKFKIAISTRKSNRQDDLDKTWEWLEFGLVNLGIGGKTSSSFGLFGLPTPDFEEEDKKSSPQQKSGYLKFISNSHNNEG